MRLIVHRGTHEIGGSCIELVTATTRVILDTGLPLVDANREPFDHTTIRGKTVEQLQAEGVIPSVAGLFSPGHRPNAILLSHSHLDHSGLLHFTDPEIPIYASRGTSKLMLAGAVFGGQRELDRGRYREAINTQPFAIGDMRITPFAVDHSAFGSMAFLVEAEGKTVLYSGDVRLHGRKPGMMKSLVEAIKPCQPDVLLIEGTHFGCSPEVGISEFDLEERIVELTKSSPGLVLAAFSPMDVDRLVTFYRGAQRTQRTFVADAYTAFILHLVASDAKIPRATKEAGIRVFFNQAFQNRKNDKLQDLFAGDRIELTKVLEQPQRHLMVFRPNMTRLDFGGKLPTQARCIYSFWSGYLKRPDWGELQTNLTAVGGDFIPAHTSGHAYVSDLIEFVRSINAKTIVPIHTFEPASFANHFDNVRVLNDGEPHEIN